jgi:tRNA uridine 5-carboxymethylaminomethyl modification enzyme
VEGVVTTDGRTYRARAIVVTAGTFLRGRIHLGLATQVPAGRAGEAPAVDIAQDIEALGVTVERFKTGTPPRIDGRTVELKDFERQDGDPGDYWFSWYQRHPHPPQLPCYLTHTGDRLREIITAHLRESALYGGAISGRGPRYCPSIEDKIVRFPDARRHQVFLEPEGLETSEMYVNGLSTSLPVAVQLEYLRSVPGLERVEMTRPGYAIEYDYYPPTQLDQRLALKSLDGLFFAGQVNGTTGYEEAAGQGAIAGMNAAAHALGRESVILGRQDGFIGVLVDDLVTRGVDEPYRLFTSRSEFRLTLRQDNALRRLFPLAVRLGLLTDEERATAERRLEAEDRAMGLAKGTVVRPSEANPVLAAAGELEIREPVRIEELCRRPGVGLIPLLEAAGFEVEPSEGQWAEIELRYAGYVMRERTLARRMAELDEFKLPEGLGYGDLVSLSFEAREKLAARRPATLGQASRIPGITPSDLHSLLMEVSRATI